MHTVRIDSISEIHYFGGSGYCTVHTIGWDTVQSSTLTFIYAGGCISTPTVTLNSPTASYYYPANTTTVPLQWTISNNTCTGFGEYNRVKVWDSGVDTTTATPLWTKSITSPAAPNNVANGTYPVAPDTASFTSQITKSTSYCNTTSGTSFQWKAEAKNTDSTAGVSSVRSFTIAPNKVELITLAQLACVDPGDTISTSVTFNDYNYMADKFKFRLMSGSVQVGSDMFFSCSTAGTVTTCPVSFAAPSAAGTYTLMVSHMNNTGTKCSGPGGDSYSTEENVFGAGGTLPVGGSVVGTLGFDSSATGSTELQTVLNISNFPIGALDTASITFQYALNPSGVSCDTLSYLAIPSAWFISGGSSTISCARSNIDAGNCNTNPFIPASSGRYCYKAVVNSGVSGCGGVINNTLEDYVYKTNVHVLRDVNDTLPCDDNDPSIIDGAAKLNGKTVTFSTGGTSLQEVTTSSEGLAPFSFRMSSGSPNLTFEIRCGEVNAQGVITTPCVPDQSCRDNYLDCAGSDIDNVYAEVPNSSENLIYNKTVTLATPRDYNFYLRLGSTPEPDDWLTTVDGDVYASGMALHMCTETSFEGITFDGGLSERPEGDPYASKLGGFAEAPYTGGYVFTDSAKGDAVFEVSDDLFTEGNPVGRSAFSINAISGENFKDLRFDLMASSTENGSAVPSGVTASKLAGVNLSEQKLDSGSVYLADNIDRMNAVLNGGDYILQTNPHGDKVAVIYYTDSGSGNELHFTKDFVNKNKTSTGRVVIISAQDIIIDASVGYDCAPSFTDPTQTICGTKTGGTVNPLNEYSPDDTDFPANIDAVLVSYGTITVLGADDPSVTDDVKLLKINGSLIAAGGISFERSLGNLALKYPGEMVRYNSDILYNLTKMERSSATTGLSTSIAQIEYGY